MADDIFTASSEGNLEFFESHQSFDEGNWEVVGVDEFYSQKNDRGQSPLYLAAKFGHLHVVKFLVDHGCDVNEVEDTYQSTPLHSASYYGHQDVVEYLIGVGADPTAINSFGCIPVSEANTSEIEEVISNPRRVDASRFAERHPFPHPDAPRPPPFTDKQSSLGVVKAFFNTQDFPKPWFWHERESDRDVIAEELRQIPELNYAATYLHHHVDASPRDWNLAIIRAYSMENDNGSSLYGQMNAELALQNKFSHCLKYACALRKALEEECPVFAGETYRSVWLSEGDLQRYQARRESREPILFDAFLSTSKDKTFAMDNFPGNALLVFEAGYTTRFATSARARSAQTAVVGAASVGALGKSVELMKQAKDAMHMRASLMRSHEICPPPPEPNAATRFIRGRIANYGSVGQSFQASSARAGGMALVLGGMAIAGGVAAGYYWYKSSEKDDEDEASVSQSISFGKRDISSWSVYPGESEVLFMSGMNFVVIDVVPLEHPSKQWVIRLAPCSRQ